MTDANDDEDLVLGDDLEDEEEPSDLDFGSQQFDNRSPDSLDDVITDTAN